MGDCAHAQLIYSARTYARYTETLVRPRPVTFHGRAREDMVSFSVEAMVRG